MNIFELVSAGLAVKVSEGSDIEVYSLLKSPGYNKALRYHFISEEANFNKDATLANFNKVCLTGNPVIEPVVTYKSTTDISMKSTLVFSPISLEQKDKTIDAQGIVVSQGGAGVVTAYVRFKRKNNLRGSDVYRLGITSKLKSPVIKTIKVLNTDTNEEVKFLTTTHPVSGSLSPLHPVFGTLTEYFAAGITNETYLRTQYPYLLIPSVEDQSAPIQALGLGKILSNDLTNEDGKIIVKRTIELDISKQTLNQDVLYFSDLVLAYPWGCVCQRFYPEHGLGTKGKFTISYTAELSYV